MNPNTVKKPRKAEAHKNFMGGTSYDVLDPVKRLRMMAASCFFGEPMYYRKTDKDKPITAGFRDWSSSDFDYLSSVLESRDRKDWKGLDPKSLLTKAIDESLDHDFFGTLQVAVDLRQEDNIRVTPQVIFVRAAHHQLGRGSRSPICRSNPNLMLQYAPQILQRADEPAVQLAYHLSEYGKEKAIPNVLKKAWKAALEGHDDYRLAKYRLDDHIVKTIDVVRLCHANSKPINKLCRGTLSISGKTWESIVSDAGAEAAELKKSGKDEKAQKVVKKAWKDSIEVMGHMALLRNLRNFITQEVPEDLYLTKLMETVKFGRQLPFRYYSAYQAVKDAASPKVLDTIEKALVESLENIPKFPGKVMSLCDNSGSAQGTTTSKMGAMRVSTIGNLTGVITGMNSDEGYLGVFGDRLEIIPVRKKSSVFDTLEKAEKAAGEVGLSTENGVWLFWNKAIKNNEHWDSVFIYSDMQAGHGGLYGTDPKSYSNYVWHGSRNIDVAKLIKDYRREVNPDVNVYLVQIAGYQDTIVPDFYNKTYILGGWGDGILRFAGAMSGVARPKVQGDEEEPD